MNNTMEDVQGSVLLSEKTRAHTVRKSPQCNGPAATPRMTYIDGSALYTAHLPEPVWIVPGLIPEGLTILAGRPKSGKSWLAYDLALEVARGGCALGNKPFAVEQGRVLLLALEDSERRLQDRMKALCHGGSPPPPGFLHIATVGTGFPLLDQGGRNEIEGWLRQHPDARLVVVDTLKKIRPAGTGRRSAEYDNDYEFTGELQQIALRHRVAILCVHHTRKAAAEDPFDEISGTLGITAAADALMVLKPKGNSEGILHARGRDFEEQRAALRFHNGSWTWNGDADRLDASDERRAVLELLENEGPMTSREIAEHVEKKHGTIQQLLWKMAKAQQIIRTGRTYRLCRSSPVNVVETVENE